MIKKFKDEKSDEIKNALQETYIDAGYESLEDFEKDYYSFKPVSVRDLIAFSVQVKKNFRDSKTIDDYNFHFWDQYGLFENAVFDRPNIKPTTIESEEDEKESKNKSEDKGSINSV